MTIKEVSVYLKREDTPNGVAYILYENVNVELGDWLRLQAADGKLVAAFPSVNVSRISTGEGGNWKEQKVGQSKQKKSRSIKQSA